jgi:spore germination protein YaaH
MILPLLLAMPLAADTALQPPADEVVSVHSEALRVHRDLPRAVRSFPQPKAVRSNVQRIVYGYLPYWVTNTSAIQWDLLTHVADFSIEMKSDGTLGAKNGWPDKALVDAAHNAGVKVEPVFTLFNSTSLATLLNTKANRTTAINNMVAEMKAGNADGVSLDFEGVPASARDGLTAFCQELRAALTAAGYPQAGISIAAPAVDWSDAFDIAQLLDSIDVYFIMGYDYFWSGSSMAGPTGIFRTSSKWLPAASWTGLRSVAATARLAGEQKRKKVVYGIPYYGREYTTPSNTWPSAANSNVGARTYAVTREMLASGTPKVFDDKICQPAMVWQAAGVWHQLWYEDVQSLGCKYGLVLEQAIGGTGMWALGSDNGYTDLWELLDTRFSAPAALGEGSRDAPIPVAAFPYEDARDTSKGGFRYFNYYGCKDTTPEYGREFIYQLDLCQPGNLHVQVQGVGGSDPDVHLLSDLKESACLARADVTIDQALQPGRYYVVVDTYVASSVEQEGPYQLTVDFTAQQGSSPCPAGTTCEAGVCACPGQQSLCDAVCVDTSSDAHNCGGCGTQCESGESCEQGSCKGPQDAGAEAEAAVAKETGAAEAAVEAADGEAPELEGGPAPAWSTPEEEGCSCAQVGGEGARRGWLALGIAALAMLRGRKRARGG